MYGSANEAAAVECALHTLVRIQSLTRTTPDLIPDYATSRLHDEFELCPTWLVEGLLARTVSAAERAMLDDVRGILIASISAQPRCCVHRDYHSRNLLWHQGRLGIVDFQDALWGPQLYDLASLLRDCYHRFPETEVVHWRRRYAELARQAGLPSTGDAATFAQSFDYTAVQRQIKAIGIFARLKLRDHRNTHLEDIVPVIDQLISVTANHQPLAPLSRWLMTRSDRPRCATSSERPGQPPHESDDSCGRSR
ncbi:MAG: phosphotransferase [Gammaproteobacteria bacterium]|nr:phosphotransferase [Gammaproteobacteria bacterium]